MPQCLPDESEMRIDNLNEKAQNWTMDEFPAVSLDGLSLGNDGVGEAARPAEEVDRNPVAVVVGHLRLKQSCKMSNLLDEENSELNFFPH